MLKRWTDDWVIDIESNLVHFCQIAPEMKQRLLCTLPVAYPLCFGYNSAWFIHLFFIFKLWIFLYDIPRFSGRVNMKFFSHVHLQPFSCTWIIFHVIFFFLSFSRHSPLFEMWLAYNEYRVIKNIQCVYVCVCVCVCVCGECVVCVCVCVVCVYVVSVWCVCVCGVCVCVCVCVGCVCVWCVLCVCVCYIERMLYALYRIICFLLQVNCTNLAIGLISNPSSLVVSFVVTSLILSLWNAIIFLPSWEENNKNIVSRYCLFRWHMVRNYPTTNTKMLLMLMLMLQIYN